MIPSDSCNVRGECCSTPSPTASPTKNPTQRPTTAAPTTPNPTPNPTPQPTPSPFDAAFAEMMAYAETKSSRSSLRNTNSPQYKAVEWLAQDKADNGSNWNGYELLQRYVLRVLYHSTGGENWGCNGCSYFDADTTWFQPASVCDWGSDHARCSGNGQQVDYISFFKNKLQGTIPDELGLLTALTYLHLRSNELTGTLPSQLGQLTALTYLEFWSNRLTGTIPTQLGKLTALPVLSLRDNQLTDTIPSQLGYLTALTELYLQNNQLSRTIPLTLTQLTNLKILYFHDNNLVGQVPSGFCAASFPDWRADGAYGNDRLWADCMSDVQCACCDKCFDETGNEFCWSNASDDFVSC